MQYDQYTLQCSENISEQARKHFVSYNLFLVPRVSL